MSKGIIVNGHNLVVDGGVSAGRPATTMRAAWQALTDLVHKTPSWI
ncbi:MAG TPA: hypothetical protein VMH37_07820 [Candidatus Binataceae bacterium]|nr:hypothetical protein [Candidatus Binataceae bacterium]